MPLCEICGRVDSALNYLDVSDGASSASLCHRQSRINRQHLQPRRDIFRHICDNGLQVLCEELSIFVTIARLLMGRGKSMPLIRCNQILDRLTVIANSCHDLILLSRMFTRGSFLTLHNNQRSHNRLRLRHGDSPSATLSPLASSDLPCVCTSAAPSLPVRRDRIEQRINSMVRDRERSSVDIRSECHTASVA